MKNTYVYLTFIGTPSYYVVIECGTQSRRSKVSSGWSTCSLFFNLSCETWAHKFPLILNSYWNFIYVMQESIRNLGGMRNSYLISRRLIARTQPISNVESWPQNSSEMVDLWVKPSTSSFRLFFLFSFWLIIFSNSFCPHQLLHQLYNYLLSIYC